MSDYKYDLKEVTKTSIEDYMSSRGFDIEKRGRLKYCKSPFSADKTASFCIYPTNTFYDWSNGIGGDIVNLVSEMENCSTYEALHYISEGSYDYVERESKVEVKEVEFNIKNFISLSDKEAAAVHRYAAGRCLLGGYIPSVYFVYDKRFVRRPSVGYVHTDEKGDVCGIKMRDIDPYNGRRFGARGKQMYYVLSNDIKGDAPVYIVESESSALSLYQFFRILNMSVNIVSFGSWSNVPNKLPDMLEDNKNRRLIIDYDGNEELYLSKLEKFTHLGAQEIRLELEKGEDMNSLFIKGKLYMYKDAIL